MVYNFEELKIDSLATWCKVMVFGMRFDISAIFWTNVVFVIAMLFPTGILKKRYIRAALKYLFIFTNICFLTVNWIDVVYFPFVKKRMQADAFLFVNGEKGTELFHLIPSFIIQYFPLWICAILSVVLLIKITNAQFKRLWTNDMVFRWNFFAWIFPVFTVGIFILGARGGWQLKPLSIIHASESAGPENAFAILNSTFSIIQTIDKAVLTEKNYFNFESLTSCERGIHKALPTTNRQHPNIIVIIVESLSKSYVSGLGGTGKTPFLDSLMDHSLVYTNGFANARESVNGIPAVLASIPSLMDDAFIFSRYSSNDVTSVASVLKGKGYHTAFFHGGATGTMGFNTFCLKTGFDQYFGKEDYPDRADFDGYWGIWDHKFFPFMIQELSKSKEPFFSAVFTMNPHHPFKLPKEFALRFTENGHPVRSMIRYEDYALSEFFRKAQSQKWYSNTIFVITADHTGPIISGYTKMDDFRIPIIFYSPKELFCGVSDRISAQIDIMPTLLNYINADTSYFSLGKDLFSSSCEKGSIIYIGGIYHYINQTHYLQYNGEKLLRVFDWKNDKTLKNNILVNNVPDEATLQSLTEMQKAIQVFNHSMINNAMKVVKIPNQKSLDSNQ
jgi:arylsulfatase A-like enzyme